MRCDTIRYDIVGQRFLKVLLWTEISKDLSHRSRSQVIWSYWLHLWPPQPTAGWLYERVAVPLLSWLWVSRESTLKVGPLGFLFECNSELSLFEILLLASFHIFCSPSPVHWLPHYLWFLVQSYCSSIILIDPVGCCGEFYSHRHLFRHQGTILCLTFFMIDTMFCWFANLDPCALWGNLTMRYSAIWYDTCLLLERPTIMFQF